MYIEREKLKQAFSTDTQNIRSWDVDLFDLLMIVIDEAPTADVVPIVRCKDCKYLEITGCYGECSKGYLGIVRPDCYCCYGERKETFDNG